MLSESTLPRFLTLFILIISLSAITCYAQEIDEYLLWAKVSNFPHNSNANVNQSDLDVDGNLYVIGTYFKEFPWEQDPSQTINMLQIFLRKYDSDGNLLWSKEFGTDKYYSFAGDIRVDKQGDIVFTGYLYDVEGTVFGQPVLGFFLAKMDVNANLKWITPFSKTTLWTWGERGGILCKQSKMEIGLDNSIVLYSNNNPGEVRNASHGLYISRYSSSGDLLQQYQITHDDNFDSPCIGGLVIDKDGNFIITGYYHVSLQIGTEIFGIPGTQSDKSVQLFLAKFSATGVFMWAKVTVGLSVGNDVDVDNSGNIYLTGIASAHTVLGGSVQLNPGDSDSAFIAKLDPNGQTIWSNLIGGARPISLKRTSSGDLYISGTFYNNLSYGNYNWNRFGQEDAFVLKINSDNSLGGAIVSSGNPLGLAFRVAYNSSIDNSGNIYTIGNFGERIVFGCDILSPGPDMFITKYSSLPPGYILSIYGPSTLCEGEALSLSTTAIPEPVKYFWTIPDGVTVTSQMANQVMASVTPSANGREVAVEIRKGCYNYRGLDPYKVNIESMPVPIMLHGQQMYCDPQTARFSSTVSTNATSYLWELPTGITAEQNTLVTNSPYIDVVISNEFTEGAILAKGKNECFDGELSEGLKVQLIKVPSPVSFLNIKNEYCNRGQSETFEVTKSEHASEYIWKIPSTMNEAGTIASSSNNIRLSLKNQGKELISVYAKNACHKTEEISHPIKTTDPLTEPNIFKSNCDLELTTDGTENIEWFKNAQKFGQDTPAVPLSDDGVYYVSVTNFCGTVESPRISANPVIEEQLFIPNVITPDNDGKNDFFALEPDLGDLYLEIFNRWGKQVYQTQNYKNDWDGSGLEAGVYFFRVQHSCLKENYKGWLQMIR